MNSDRRPQVKSYKWCGFCLLLGDRAQKKAPRLSAKCLQKNCHSNTISIEIPESFLCFSKVLRFQQLSLRIPVQVR